MNRIAQPPCTDTAVRARRISVSPLVDIHELTGFFLTLVCARNGSDGAAGWLASVLGGTLRSGVGTLYSNGNGTVILGVGPGRWLVRGAQALTGVAKPADVAQFDVSDAWRVFRLGSIAARRLLASGCPLDLQPRRFAPPSCAVTRFDECRVILCCTAADTYEMYVERSVAEDLRARLVLRAAAMASPAELES